MLCTYTERHARNTSFFKMCHQMRFPLLVSGGKNREQLPRLGNCKLYCSNSFLCLPLWWDCIRFVNIRRHETAHLRLYRWVSVASLLTSASFRPLRGASPSHASRNLPRALTRPPCTSTFSVSLLQYFPRDSVRNGRRRIRAVEK